MIVEILGAEGRAKHSWADQGMLDRLRTTTVLDAQGQALDQTEGLIGRAQQDTARIGHDRPAIKIGHHDR